MVKRIPQNLGIAFTLSFISFSFVLFFFPNSLFQAINAYFAQVGVGITLPVPFENQYAFIYAFFPASFSIYVTYLVAHGVRRGELGR